MGTPLPNKPLVEAIFELRWTEKNGGYDPYYNLLPGIFSEKLKAKFPFMIPLPASNAPINLVQKVPQYQFRKTEGGWPVIQLGPGIISANSTADYTWEGYFYEICLEAIQTLFGSHQKLQENIESLEIHLRYINAIKFKKDETNYSEALNSLLKIQCNLPKEFFDVANFGTNPAGMTFEFAYPTTSPVGLLNNKFVSVLKDGEPGLLWEIVFASGSQRVPSDIDFAGWLLSAHDIIEKNFHTFIDGELKRRFTYVD